MNLVDVQPLTKNLYLLLPVMKMNFLTNIGKVSLFVNSYFLMIFSCDAVALSVD